MKENNQKILHLTLKKIYFDMIYSGFKPEEYRAVKQYWVRRLFKHYEVFEALKGSCIECKHRKDFEPHEVGCSIQDKPIQRMTCNIDKFEWLPSYFNNFDLIQFTNGYSKTSPSFKIECKGIEIGIGKPEWGAPPEPVFIIKLGNVKP